MAIEFRCKACGTLIQAADEHAGVEVKCPTCGAVVVAPATQPTGPGGLERGTPGHADSAIPSMSPPPPGSFPAVPTDPGKKGLAAASLVFGIIGCCLPGLGLLGIILGIVALVRIGHNPQKYGGKGLAVAGICTGGSSFVVVAILGLLLSVFLPSAARARELSRRTGCAAKLKSIGLGCCVYSGESENEYWPIAAHPEATEEASGLVDYTQAIGSYRARDIDGMSPLPTTISTARNLWTLIRVGASSPKSFVCPSTDDAPNDESNPQDYWDFGSGSITKEADPAEVPKYWRQVSYGYQVPYGKIGRPSSSRDPRMVLVADKGPFGAALDGGLVHPPAISADSRSSPNDWRRWNSPNHGGQGSGEGQNCLFADGHVEFLNKPNIGAGEDNIYTQWAGRGQVPIERIQGKPPALEGRETPVGNTDSLIYP